MTTYEEEIVDIFYNLQGYFTILNIPFSASEKRKGGKGRGEIDVLAIKISEGKVVDAVHSEVSVSLTAKFPFTAKTHPNQDESFRLIKKFFNNDSETKIKEYIGETQFRRIVISSDFDKNSVERLKKRIPGFSGTLLNFKR